LEHSIHDVDLFRWLFGDIEGVRCHTRNVAGHPGIEDVAIATFDHSGGHQTTLASVWHDVDSRPSSRGLEVFFQRGWFATDADFIGSLTYQLGNGPEVTLTADEVFARYVEVAKLSEAEADLARAGVLADYLFLRAVSAGEPALPDFATAAKAHAVVESAYQSAADKGDLRIVV
jgi:predicted dehydrogenase